MILKSLTVTVLFGTLVPLESISPISSSVVMPANNCSREIPLKFQGASFGAIKVFLGKFFIGA